MSKVLIVYATDYGHTKTCAEAVAKGVESAGGTATVKNAVDATADDIRDADALVLGSGVHMAGMESSMRAFFERVSSMWLQGEMVGKVGAAFVSAGSGARGGAELTLISLWANLAEHGMLLVPMHNRLDGFAAAGCHWGPVAWTNPRAGQAGPTETHVAACRAHGKWVAECTARLSA